MSGQFYNSSVIVHCVYVPQLSYPFVCQWTCRLLPCPSYCKQGCDEHWGTCVFLNSCFLSVYAQQWNCRVVWRFYFQFWFSSGYKPRSGIAGSYGGFIPSVLRNLRTVFHSVCINFHSHHSARVFPFPHTLSSIYCL